MIKYYYASIVDRNLYIDGINFLDYLDSIFQIFIDIIKRKLLNVI